MNSVGIAFGIALACAGSQARTQDILHYKFDGGCDATVLNYAAGSPAPAVATLVTNLGAPTPASWTPGRFGLALARGGAPSGPRLNYVDTGWAPNGVTGSISWACWLKIDPSVVVPAMTGLFSSTACAWLCIGNGGFMTTNPQVTFPGANLMSMARNGWIHVAVVLDARLGQVDYYVNGGAQGPMTVAAFQWTGSPLQLGIAAGYAANSVFDIDEFVLANRAMTPLEIRALAGSPRAGDATFGTSQGATLTGNGQRPFLGNPTYGVVLHCNAGPACVVFGRSRCTMAGGTINLPVDLGSLDPWLGGLTGYVDTDLGVVPLLVGGGATPIRFPLPDVAGLSGFPCYGQALALDAGTLQFATSNALAIGIGR